MAKNILDNCKPYLRYYYNADGTWVKEPEHKWHSKDVAPEAIQFMSDFFHFLIESTVLSEYSLAWLNSNLSSMRAMVDAHNDQAGSLEQWVQHTVLSNIDYDKRKLKDFFKSADVIDEVFAYPQRYVPHYADILDSLQRTYMQDKQYNQALMIKIPKKIINRNIDERSWALLVQLLRTYSKTTVNSIMDGTHPLYTHDLFGYYNYLISSKRLDAEEKQRLQEIKTILGIA